MTPAPTPPRPQTALALIRLPPLNPAPQRPAPRIRCQLP